MMTAIKFHAGFGKVNDGWVPISGMDFQLENAGHGSLAEKIVEGYNDKANRKPIKGQTGHQMISSQIRCSYGTKISGCISRSMQRIKTRCWRTLVNPTNASPSSVVHGR